MKKLFVIAALISLLLLSGSAFAGITTYIFKPFDGSTNSNGDPYNTTGQQNDIDDLDHYYYYSWRVTGSLAANEHITSASLTFNNIINWDNTPHQLYVHLLNTPNTDDTANSGTWQSDSSNPYADGAVWYASDKQNGGDAFTGNWSPGPLEHQKLIGYRYNASDLANSTKFKLDGDGVSLTDATNGTLYFPSVGGTSGNPYNNIPKNINYYFDPITELPILKQYFSSADNTFGIGLDPDCHYWNNGISLTITTFKPDSPPGGGSAVPEPATLILFGSGLVALAGLGRKHLKK